MRALVSGAAGFIGSHLVDRLVRDGWHVRALIHKSPLEAQPNVEAAAGDIRDIGVLGQAMSGVDTVFHLATAAGSRQIGREEFRAVNARGTECVLEAAGKAGVRRVIHFSSAGVLGHVQTGRPADETIMPAPVDIYDRTKLEGELIARDFARRGQDVVIVRPGWVYGPRDRRTWKLIRAVGRRRLVLVSGGKALQSPVYIDDLVEGTMLCAAEGASGEIYHLAGNEVLTVREMCLMIAASVGTTIPRISLPRLPAKIAAGALGAAFGLVHKEAPLNPSRLAFFLRSKPLDSGKARRDLGYAPSWSFERGIAASVGWYRAQGWL